MENTEKFVNVWLLAPFGIVVFFVVIAIIWRVFLYLWDKNMKRRQTEKLLNLNESEKTHLLVNDEDEMGIPLFNTEEIMFEGFKKKEETLDISFVDLGLELKSGKRVLEGVTGSIRHGRLTAIMGKITFFFKINSFTKHQLELQDHQVQEKQHFCQRKLIRLNY